MLLRKHHVFWKPMQGPQVLAKLETVHRPLLKLHALGDKAGARVSLHHGFHSGNRNHSPLQEAQGAPGVQEVGWKALYEYTGWLSERRTLPPIGSPSVLSVSLQKLQTLLLEGIPQTLHFLYVSLSTGSR